MPTLLKILSELLFSAPQTEQLRLKMKCMGDGWNARAIFKQLQAGKIRT